MTREQADRLDVLRATLPVVGYDPEVTGVAEHLAMAEWVADGSISAALTLRGQTTALYRDREEP